MLDFGISSAVFRKIFFFEFRHTNRFVESRAHGRRAFDAEAGGLDGARDFLPSEKRMNAPRGFFAFSDGVHNLTAAVGAITAGEHFRKISLARVGIPHNHAAGVQFERWEKLFQKDWIVFLRRWL